MRKRSKRFRKAFETVDRLKRHSVEEAVVLVQETGTAKFDETVEIVLRLGIDSRKSEQMVRGSVSLPRGIGKTRTVIVFAEGEDAETATAAGADEVGGADLVKKIQDGWADFDIAIAKPAMMRHVGKLGKLLGPRGLMPNAKTGTVTFDVARAVQDLKAGKIEFKAEKTGIVQAPMGKVSFGVDKIVQNMAAFFDMIMRLKPASSKGTYLKGIAISTTMGPGLKIDSALIKDLLK